MTCQDALKLINQLLDREASGEARALLSEHTRECQACAEEWRRQSHWDELLRAPDPEEPNDHYFDDMARTISFGIGKREREPAPILAPSWAFSSVMAAACLAIGLGLGHIAMPKTIAKTETVVQRVPGPVREVPVEVKVPVNVPVPGPVQWKTRTVVRYRPTPTRRPERVASAPEAAEPAADTPAEPAVAETPATPEATWAARGSAGGTYGVHLASYSPRRGDPGLDADELRVLATRLAADMTAADEALGTSRLAVALVSGIDTAEVELERAISADTTAAAGVAP